MMIELLVAIVVITLSLLAVLAGLDINNRGARSNQLQAQMIAVAQQEIEKVESYASSSGFSSIALTSTPPHESSGVTDNRTHNPIDPNYWVSGTNLLIKSSYSDDTSTTLASEPLVVAAGGAVAPGPSVVTSGGQTFQVYRYVTYRQESCLVTACPQGASKRITVAVVPPHTALSGPVRPLYTSTVIDDTSPSLCLLGLCLNVNVAGVRLQ
jgi:type II secretory pathway pseudopilin PulG